MAREIRITFTDKEQEIYDFIKGKSSASNFIKDLVRLEKERQENYTNSLIEGNLELLAEKLANKLGKVEIQDIPKEEVVNEEPQDDYDFNVDDILN